MQQFPSREVVRQRRWLLATPEPELLRQSVFSWEYASFVNLQNAIHSVAPALDKPELRYFYLGLTKISIFIGSLAWTLVPFIRIPSVRATIVELTLCQTPNRASIGIPNRGFTLELNESNPPASSRLQNGFQDLSPESALERNRFQKAHLVLETELQTSLR